MEFDPKAFWFLGSVPLILGAIQFVKQWVSDARWYGPLAILLGVVFNVLIGHLIGQTVTISIIVGVVAAFTAQGVIPTIGSMFKKP